MKKLLISLLILASISSFADRKGTIFHYEEIKIIKRTIVSNAAFLENGKNCLEQGFCERSENICYTGTPKEAFELAQKINLNTDVNKNVYKPNPLVPHDETHLEKIALENKNIVLTYLDTNPDTNSYTNDHENRDEISYDKALFNIVVKPCD